MEPEIELVGFSQLPKGAEGAKDIVDAETAKLLHKFDIAHLRVHIKTHLKGDHPSHYSCNIHADIHTKHCEVLKEDHDPIKLIHKSFDALQNELVHHLNRA